MISTSGPEPRSLNLPFSSAPLELNHAAPTPAPLRRHEPDHPLLVEAYAEATTRFLDLPAALAFLDTAATLPIDLVAVERVSPSAFGMFVSRIKETMMLEDPETTIERLFHDMYGTLADSDPPNFSENVAGVADPGFAGISPAPGSPPPATTKPI